MTETKKEDRLMICILSGAIILNYSSDQLNSIFTTNFNPILWMFIGAALGFILHISWNKWVKQYA